MKIEDVICSLPEVRHCAAVGRKNPERGYDVVVYTVAEPGLDKTDIRNKIMEICNRELNQNSRLAELRFVSSLPVTRAGKTDFKALEKMAEQ